MVILHVKFESDWAKTSRYRVHKVKWDGPTHEPTHEHAQPPTNGRVTISPPTLLRGDNYFPKRPSMQRFILRRNYMMFPLVL